MQTGASKIEQSQTGEVAETRVMRRTGFDSLGDKPREQALKKRADVVGQIILQSYKTEQKEKQTGFREDKKDKPKEKTGFDTAIEERELELEGLHGKKEVLEKAKVELVKKSETFKKADKETTEILKDFSADEKDLMFGALDREFNPEAHEKDGKNPGNKTKIEKEDAALAKFDGKAEAKGKPVAGTHLAAFMYLHEEKISDAENALNGTQEQNVVRQISFLSAENAAIQVLRDSPDIARQIWEISKRPETSAEQKIGKIRDIHGVLSSVDDPEKKSILDKYASALAEQVSWGETFKREIARGEIEKRNSQEAFVRLQEMSDQEQALARLGEVEGDSSAKKESKIEGSKAV